MTSDAAVVPAEDGADVALDVLALGVVPQLAMSALNMSNTAMTARFIQTFLCFLVGYLTRSFPDATISTAHTITLFSAQFLLHLSLFQML